MFKNKRKLALYLTCSLLTFSLVSCGERSNISEQENNENSDQNNNENNGENGNGNTDDNGNDSEGENGDNNSNVEGSFSNPILVTIPEAKVIASKLENDTVSDKFYKCSGTVTQLVKQSSRTEFILHSGTHNIRVYYILNIDKYPRLSNNDEVTFVSRLKQFNGDKEFHRATLTEVKYSTPEVVRKSFNEELFNDSSISYTSISEALRFASALPEDPESEGTIQKYWVKGFVEGVVTATGTTRHFKLCPSIGCSESEKIFVNIEKSAYNALEIKYEDDDEIILYGSLRNPNGPQIFHPEIKAFKIHN